MKTKRKAEQWPVVRWAEKEQAWKVDARTKDGGQRRFFTTKGEAAAWAEQQRIERKNEGDSAFKFSAGSRIDATAAMELLAPYRHFVAGVRRLLRPPCGDSDRRQDHPASRR